jgi:hypothetical protein
MKFRPISFDDIAEFRARAEKARTLACVKSFAYLYMWSAFLKTEISIQDEAIYIRGKHNNGYKYFAPLLTGDAHVALTAIREHMVTEGTPFKLSGVDIEMAQAATEQGLKVRERRDAAEYLYSVTDLSQLSGKKYHAKRNFVNRFMKENQFAYEDMNSSHFEPCLELARNWSQGKEDVWVDREYDAIKAAFNAWDKLELEGGVIKIDEKIVAFTVGEAVGNMAMIHFEKADASIPGAYATINQLFLKANFSHVTYVNRQEDLGLEGLRKAKLSYHPIDLVLKYDISEK